MSGDEHDRGALAGHALNALDGDERASLEQHLATCAPCRQELDELTDSVRLLDELPPEALLEGPPEDGELLLQRTLRQVRAESDRAAFRRRAALAVAAVLILAAGVLGGAAVFRGQEPAPVATPPPAGGTTEPTEPLPEGTRVGSNTDPETDASMTVRVLPAAGWVRVDAAVSGIPEGQECRLWVVASDGSRSLAGSWLVSAQGAAEGTTLDGSALVAPEDVVAVEVDNVDGRRYVSVPL